MQVMLCTITSFSCVCNRMIRIFNTLYLPQDLRRVSVAKPLRVRDPLDDFAAYG